MRILANRLILFQTTPAGVVTEPQQIAVHVGHLSWDANLVTVGVVGLSSVFAVFVDAVSIREIAYIRAAHSTSGLKVFLGTVFSTYFIR